MMPVQDFREIVVSLRSRARRSLGRDSRALDVECDSPRDAFLKGQISAFNFVLSLFDCVADGTIRFLPDEVLEG